MQANADTGVSAIKTSASGSINPSSRAPRVQTATGGRSKRFQDHLSKNFSNDSNTNTNATTTHAKRNAAYRISTGPQQNSSLTRAGATYGANARRKSQKIQFAAAGNQTQPLNQQKVAQHNTAGRPLVYQSLALQGTDRWQKKEEGRSVVGNSLDMKNIGIPSFGAGVPANDSALSTTNAAATVLGKNSKIRKSQVLPQNPPQV